MEIKVKASFKSVDLDLAIEILDGNILSGLDGGNGTGDKGLGGLSGGDKSGLLTPVGCIKGVHKGVDTGTPSTVGYK